MNDAQIHEFTEAAISCFGNVAADKLLTILTAEVEADGGALSYPAADDYLRQCYHAPGDDMLRLKAMGEALTQHAGIMTFGVEGHHDEDTDIGYSYVNRGDTYDATVLLDDDDVFHVMSWGDYQDWIEQQD